MTENNICLDASCFTSVENLRNTKHLLNEIRRDNPFLIVYVPTSIHKAINKLPPQKFRELPPLIEDWIDEEEYDNVKSLDKEIRDDYVYVMKEFLDKHRPLPAENLVGEAKKIGNESIYLDDLIKKFGDIKAKILFDIMFISWNYKAKIIALREITFSLMKIAGTQVKQGFSKVKQELKNRARIRTHLFVAMLFMEHYGIMDFIEDFKIEGVEIPSEILPAAGLLYFVDG